jgi:hypothetical protein
MENQEKSTESANATKPAYIMVQIKVIGGFVAGFGICQNWLFLKLNFVYICKYCCTIKK